MINSKQAKLFDKIELTDLCFLAFGSFLISFIIAGQLSFIQLLSLGGLAILPYSLYVQGFVLKKWCPLCFVISVSLVGIAVSGFWNPDLFEFSTLSIAPLLFGVLTSSLVLNLLKEVYKNRGQLFQQKLQYKTLWRSYGVVSNLLDSFQPVEVVCDPEKVSLTIVTNPLCPACKRLHDKIKRLEQEFGDAIITSYKFLVNPEDPERPAVKISAKILGQSHTDQKIALDEWYDTTDRKNWFKKWHEKADDNHYGLSKLQNQLDWAYTNKINYSPALIMDGRLVPSDYTLDQ